MSRKKRATPRNSLSESKFDSVILAKLINFDRTGD